MARVYISAIIDAPIEKAWSVLRDFNALPRYHRFFARSEIEDGLPSDQIGCVRNFYTHDGGHIRERLLTLSDREYRCCYNIIEATLPVENYVSEMTLKPVTEGNRTFGEWWAEYDVTPENAAEVHQTVSDTFRFAFEGAEDVIYGREVRR